MRQLVIEKYKELIDYSNEFHLNDNFTEYPIFENMSDKELFEDFWDFYMRTIQPIG